MALDTTIGGASADSYATLAEFQAHATAMGLAVSATDEAQEAALRRSALYLDRNYTWAGYKASEAQARAWPRDGVIDGDGYTIDVDVIPQQVKDAQCEMAWLILGGADPFATISGGSVKREKVDVVETEYSDARDRPLFVAVDALLSGLYVGKVGASFGSFTLTRA